MLLELKRVNSNETSTLGELYIDGVFFSNTMEDTDRNLNQFQSIEEIKRLKIHGLTAIPTGTYEVIVSYSNRFQMYLPLLLSVPGYDGIRMHPGNKAEDTEGCILPGVKLNDNFVTKSRITFASLFSKLKQAATKEKIHITITQDYNSPSVELT